jgi:hypothetical protein
MLLMYIRQSHKVQGRYWLPTTSVPPASLHPLKNRRGAMTEIDAFCIPPWHPVQHSPLPSQAQLRQRAFLR